MAHGKALDLTDAKTNIRKFVNDEILRTGKLESELVVGHRIDLVLMHKFMADIEVISKKVKIDSVRIYYAKSSRLTVVDEYDVVMVPVLENGNDYYPVYDRPTSSEMTATSAATITAEAYRDVTTIGQSTPCPNVCKA